MNPPSNQVNRFIAIDAHKHYVVGGLDKHMEIALPLRRIDIHCFPDWARKHLLPSDYVVIEASTNTWTLYDIIAPLVARILVANPYKVRLIAACPTPAPAPATACTVSSTATTSSPLPPDPSPPST